MNIPELLAPVGSPEAFIAAVQNGADAVYLGGKMFSARQYADNFDRDQLREAFEYAHVRDVKVYVTVNTLLSDRELPEAVDYLRFLYEAGVDAVIVQDIGLAGAIHKLLPGLPLHASTQMTVHNSGGVRVLQNHGFSRIVLARELSLKEIRDIKAKTGANLEVFVHGALCVSYSGQCLMSSMIGGRSGNRGRCAQPCRMEYSLVDESGRVLVDRDKVGAHILSPRDLNMIEHIPELAESGVNSLKLEGRMKRPEYVATVTRIYRNALDRYRDNPADYLVDEKELKELTQIFNRGFSTGYFFGKQGRDMMSFKRPNNRGLRLGRVVRSEWNKKAVEIALEDRLRTGDGIEFWVTEGGRKGTVVSQIILDGKSVEEAPAGTKVTISAEGRIKPGDRVFKTHDARLMAEAEQTYSSARESKKIPLTFRVRAVVGKLLEISVNDNFDRVFTAVGEFLGQEAQNKPLTREGLVKQLDRLGNTPYAVGSIQDDIVGNVMIPVSEINEVRRRAVEGISELRAAAYQTREPVAGDFAEQAARLFSTVSRRSIHGQTGVQGDLLLSVRTARYEILTAAVENGADTVYFGGSNLHRGTAEVTAEMTRILELCLGSNVSLVVATPRITREGDIKPVYPLLEFAKKNGLPVLVSNLGTLQAALDYELENIYADYPLNIFNSQTLDWLYANFGIAQAAVSPELTIEQIAGLTPRTKIPIEGIVEGHLQLMVTEYCPTGSLLGDFGADSKCQHPCRQDINRGLKDRLGLVFPTAHDEFCRTYIYNAKELSMIEDILPLREAGITRFRIEFSIETPERAADVVRLWRAELDRFNRQPGVYRPRPESKERLAALSPAGLTKGHYYRGVE